MKKYISLLFLPLVLIFLAPEYTLADAVINYNGTFSVYTYQYAEIENTDIIKNGKINIINCSIENSKSVLSKLDKASIKGLSAKFVGDSNELSNIIKNLDITEISREQTNKITFIYGYSPLFSQFVEYANKKINVQIALLDNTINIGVPLILGSI